MGNIVSEIEGDFRDFYRFEEDLRICCCVLIWRRRRLKKEDEEHEEEEGEDAGFLFSGLNLF